MDADSNYLPQQSGYNRRLRGSMSGRRLPLQRAGPPPLRHVSTTVTMEAGRLALIVPKVT